jgi:hypothetical protein
MIQMSAIAASWLKKPSAFKIRYRDWSEKLPVSDLWVVVGALSRNMRIA